MAENNNDPQSLPEKRKPDSDFLEGEDEPKKIKHDPEILNPKHLNDGDDDEDDNFEEKEAENKVDGKGKGVMEAINEGEEEMVMEDEEEVNSDHNFDSDDMAGEYGEDESDLDDVPLIEVYFINILRSQTRRYAPSQQEVFPVTDDDGVDEDDNG